MRVLFTTAFRETVSTRINVQYYTCLSEVKGVRIDLFIGNYTDYNVILFMGYDPKIEEACRGNPESLIGVIDVRPPLLPKALGTDFVIANGIEMRDWLADYFEHVFIFPIFPPIHGPLRGHRQHKPLVICYHGNKVHLMTMYPHITKAIEALAQHHSVELWAVYNIEGMGSPLFNLWDYDKIPLRTFQGTKDVYEKVIAQANIGIVPNLIPIEEKNQLFETSAQCNSLYVG